MKITFANVFALFIILFVFGYISFITYMSFFHSVPAFVADTKGQVMLWAGMAIAYVIGNTAGSQKKDAANADTTANLIDALKNSAPVIPAAPVMQPAAPAEEVAANANLLVAIPPNTTPVAMPPNS